jgi:hypothetical protein
MLCSKCGNGLHDIDGGDKIASISGGIMGDECTETYFFCRDCCVYSVEIYWDSFLGDGKASFRGPLSKEEGDGKVRLIGECSEPWDKNCRCNAHRAYFSDSLD